jgi:hypothetical protein
MGIYEGRKGLMDYDDVHGMPVARHVAAPPRPSQDWSEFRRAKPADRLLPIGANWLDRLPADIQPCALAAEYPRVANLIALQWKDHCACPLYFDELLVDHRGGRQGFPAAVLGDLLKLREHWYSARAR